MLSCAIACLQSEGKTKSAVVILCVAIYTYMNDLECQDHYTASFTQRRNRVTAFAAEFSQLDRVLI